MGNRRCHFVLLSLAAILGSATTHAATKDPETVNVLFIAVDDLRPELGCYGNQRVKSPNIDRLARRGVVFNRAYCQQAVCSPSRTSLMTGLRPDSTRVYDLETHFRDTVPDVVTLAEHFKRHGYASVGLGKIFHGGLNDTRSWSHYDNAGGPGWLRPENRKLVREKRKQAKAQGLEGKKLSRATRGPAWEWADVSDSRYPDGRLTDAQGRTVNFRNTVVILTSNAGSVHLLDGLSDDGEIRPDARERVLGDLRDLFRPEFLNRLDEIILFHP